MIGRFVQLVWDFDAFVHCFEIVGPSEPLIEVTLRSIVYFVAQ